MYLIPCNSGLIVTFPVSFQMLKLCEVPACFSVSECL